MIFEILDLIPLTWTSSYNNGELHRTDGPAVEYPNGDKYWWFNGKYIKCSSQEEFERLIMLGSC